KAHPDNPVYEWALATLAGKDWNAEEQHLKRAIQLAPAFARPYEDLALIAELRGDNAGRIANLKKASELNPQDPSYFFYYANAVESTNRAEGVRLEQETATRFPNTERGAQALYWAAYDTTDDQARKIAIYERLRKDCPPERFSWSESGMSDYFDVLIADDPVKASALAADMLKRITAKSEQKSWTDRAAYAEALTEAASLRAKGDGKDAVSRLMTVKDPPSYRDPAPLALALAESRRAAGDPQSAYAGLAAVVARSPSDEMMATLHAIGRALKKSPDEVDADVRGVREKTAKPAAPFTLPDYPDGRKVSLSDFRGKVVLINFWYPSCGPCRGEFPTLQRVLTKYKNRGFTILSLNVLPEEHDFVMPYLSKNGFGFRPLETTTEWAEKAYGARGYPTNFLVDRDGRIIFKPGIIRSPREQRSFELQIESLLK
ncbi:MAG TPA: redoxin domain-containing protein, partial [Vicinamibacterales bacterium]